MLDSEDGKDRTPDRYFAWHLREVVVLSDVELLGAVIDRNF